MSSRVYFVRVYSCLFVSIFVLLPNTRTAQYMDAILHVRIKCSETGLHFSFDANAMNSIICLLGAHAIMSCEHDHKYASPHQSHSPISIRLVTVLDRLSLRVEFRSATRSDEDFVPRGH